MKQEIKQEGVLYLFFKNALKVKELYKLYSLIFPKYKNLWEKLAKKEESHAKTLKNLSDRFNGGFGYLKVNQYSTQVIDYIGDFIDSQLERAYAEKLIPAEALATALSLEQSMVENKPFEMFLPLCSDIEMAFTKLNKKNQHHVKELAQAYDKIQKD